MTDNPLQQLEFSMQLQSLHSAIYQALNRLLIALELSVKRCFQPAKPHLIGGTLADITRSKSHPIAENAFLRQQLIVLQRQTKRPVLTRATARSSSYWPAVSACGERRG